MTTSTRSRRPSSLYRSWCALRLQPVFVVALFTVRCACVQVHPAVITSAPRLPAADVAVAFPTGMRRPPIALAGGVVLPVISSWSGSFAVVNEVEADGSVEQVQETFIMEAQEAAHGVVSVKGRGENRFGDFYFSGR